MLKQCDELGPNKCLKVKYENLVLHPKSEMEKILRYLDLPWMDKVLHHEQYINKPGGVSLSKYFFFFTAHSTTYESHMLTHLFAKHINLYFLSLTTNDFRVERSSDQVVKPINAEALSKWVGAIPSGVIDEMEQIAPMLFTLGYDPNANPPNYGVPDPEVAANTDDVKRNPQKWTRALDDALQKSKHLPS